MKCGHVRSGTQRPCRRFVRMHLLPEHCKRDHGMGLFDKLKGVCDDNAPLARERLDLMPRHTQRSKQMTLSALTTNADRSASSAFDTAAQK